MRIALIAWLLLLVAPFAHSHDARPGYLELHEQTPEHYLVLWKQPANGSITLALNPQFDAGCSSRQLSDGALLPGALLTRLELRCAGGIAGRSVTIVGLDATLTDVLVRLRHRSGREETYLARSSDPVVRFQRGVAGNDSFALRAALYLRLGIQHIAIGADHLLFVFGLLVLVRDPRMLFATITAFTIAHSLTLALVTLGFAAVPAPPLNTAIALSILLLGVEIVSAQRGKPSLTAQYPWLIAFVFGLFHGFGFAGGLTAMGLPRTEIPAALISFNVGVELGQLCFVLLVLTLRRAAGVLEIAWPRRLVLTPAYLVGVPGAFWTIQSCSVLVGASS